MHLDGYMKLKTTLAVMAVTLGLIACGGSSADNAAKVAGVYKGTMDILVNGESQGSFDDKTITLEKVTDDSVKVIVDAMQMGGHSAVPTMEVVSKINAKGNIGGNLEIDAHAFKITGRYEGEADGNNLNLTLQVNFGAMPMPVDIKFNGAK